MSVPARRRSSSRKRLKKPHLGLTRKKLNLCPKCQKPVLAHRACSFCGTYKGKQVLKIKTKKGKKKEEDKK